MANTTNQWYVSFVLWWHHTNMEFHCMLLLFCAKTILRASSSIELGHLKKGDGKKKKRPSASTLLRCLSMWLGASLVFKHKDEWYIAIQAYKFTDYEILYCVSMLSSHRESTNSMITHQNPESAAIPPTTTIFSLSSLRQSVEHCR